MDSRMKLFEERKLNYKLKFIFGVKFFIKISHLNFTLNIYFKNMKYVALYMLSFFNLKLLDFSTTFIKIFCDKDSVDMV